MKLSEAKPGQRVAYIPHYAEGDINDPDVEHGQIVFVNDTHVMVKLDKKPTEPDWAYCEMSQACNPDDLKLL